MPVTGKGARGFVIAFDDITHRLNDLRKRDQLLRKALDGIRSPLANLRAAAENLIAFPDMDTATRDGFLGVISEESEVLTQHLTSMLKQHKSMLGGQWVLTDAISTDLVTAVQRRLQSGDDPKITMTGLPLWLHIDSCATVVLLEHLLRRVADYTGVSNFDIEALLGDERVYMDIIWQGQRIPDAEIAGWMDDLLADAMGGTVVNHPQGGQLHQCRHVAGRLLQLFFQLPGGFRLFGKIKHARMRLEVAYFRLAPESFRESGIPRVDVGEALFAQQQLDGHRMWRAVIG